MNLKERLMILALRLQWNTYGVSNIKEIRVPIYKSKVREMSEQGD